MSGMAPKERTWPGVGGPPAGTIQAPAPSRPLTRVERVISRGRVLAQRSLHRPVLVISDDPVVSKTLAGTLLYEGYPVIEAEGLEAAIACCRKSSPWLIVARAQMQPEEGPAVIAELRRASGLPLPAIVVGHPIRGALPADSVQLDAPAAPEALLAAVEVMAERASELVSPRAADSAEPS
jgi:DNA-binding response OmpR family regulator